MNTYKMTEGCCIIKTTDYLNEKKWIKAHLFFLSKNIDRDMYKILVNAQIRLGSPFRKSLLTHWLSEVTRMLMTAGTLVVLGNGLWPREDLYNCLLWIKQTFDHIMVHLSLHLLFDNFCMQWIWFCVIHILVLVRSFVTVLQFVKWYSLPIFY